MELETTISANLAAVRARLDRAAAAAGRTPRAIRLIAVSKTFGVAHVEAAAAAGLRDLGENRIQEALQKQGATPSLPIRWHLIGHLQSNKARKAVAFDWIHSVDSAALLERLDQAATDAGRSPQLLIQVDLAHESTKHGAGEDEARRIVEAAADCRAVRLCGLMTLPPWSDDPETARPWFERLRGLRDELQAGAPESVRLDELSMGMSHDFEVAIEEGATMVRVGTALFGRRPRPGGGNAFEVPAPPAPLR